MTGCVKKLLLCGACAGLTCTAAPAMAHDHCPPTAVRIVDSVLRFLRPPVAVAPVAAPVVTTVPAVTVPAVTVPAVVPVAAPVVAAPVVTTVPVCRPCPVPRRFCPPPDRRHGHR